MAGGINRLDPSVSRALRSQVLTVSLASAIREIVQNSVDAGARKVEVLFDPLEMTFMVRDNGSGMGCHDLDQVGCQNFTSKIRQLNDLSRLRTYGFRGEALFCISKISYVTMITKRADCNCSWIREFPGDSRLFKSQRGGDQRFPVEPIPRGESGTIALVRNVLYNIPVRRKLLQNEPIYKVLLTIKEELFQILILHPETVLEVSYWEPAGQRHVLVSSCNITQDMDPFVKLSQSFTNVFGPVTPMEMFTKVSAGVKECSITGLISKCPIRVKEFQFIYLNGRRYANQSFKNTVDSIFQAAGFGGGGLTDTLVKTVGKPISNHPLIVFDVRCPQMAEDLMQDPAKNILSSSHAQILHPLIIKVVTSFLTHQGYIASPPTTAQCEDTNKATQAIYSGENVLFSPRAANSILHSKVRMAKMRPEGMPGKVKNATSESKMGHRFVVKPIIDRLRMTKLDSLPRFASQEAKDEKNNCNRMLESDWNNLGQPEDAQNVGFKLERSYLSKAEVIKQIDEKFILLKIPAVYSLSYPILAVVDQHACDERINLENYLNDFLFQVLEGTLMTQPVSNCAIRVNVTESYLFKHYKEELERWAIFYDIKMCNLESCLLVISSLPEVLNVKVNGDKEFLKNALLQMVHDLKNSKKFPIRNFCANHIFNTPRKQFEWWKYMHCLPVVFREIFNSRACRFAIMFGDTLSTPECISLIKQLAKCHIPFQCAHGRPSSVPLLKLTTEGRTSDTNSTNAKKSYLDYNIDI